MEILRRTFEAAKYPKGSEERARLNCDAVTSEYMTSYRYAVRRPFTMSDGTPHPTQPYLIDTYRTKAEAVRAAERLAQG
jgi:hypothetical protein